MAKTAIQAVGLNKWFGEGDAKTHAVKDVSFDAYRTNVENLNAQ
jgi:putative ABC transport system ATP-binding protein